MAHERRRVLHFAVTDSPSAHWTGQQLVNAFAFQTPPRFLLRDRDSICGTDFAQRVLAMGFEELKIAPRSPWQNPCVERLIGSLRRECLDQLVILNAAGSRPAGVWPETISHAVETAVSACGITGVRLQVQPQPINCPGKQT